MTRKAQEIQIQSFRGGFGYLRGLTTTAGVSLDISTPLASLLATITKSGGSLPLQVASTALPYVPGVVTAVALNKVEIRDVNDDYFRDPVTGDDVYGRITNAGAVWTLSYFTSTGGVESPYTMAAAQTISCSVPLVFQWEDFPVSLDLSVNMLDISPDNPIIGTRPVFQNLPITTLNTVPALSFVPIGALELVVNGLSYNSLDTTPAFSFVGTAVTWNAANSFPLAVGSNVIAHYFR